MKILTKEQQKMIEDNIGLVYKFCQTKDIISSFEFDDAVQIASIGLIKAILSYDKDKGGLSTYAYLCMHTEFLMALRNNKHRKLGYMQSLNEPVNMPKENSKNVYLEDLISDRLDLCDFILAKLNLELAYSKLSKRDKEIIDRFVLEGQNQQDIAKELKLAQPTISRIIRKFKNTLKED